MLTIPPCLLLMPAWNQPSFHLCASFPVPLCRLQTDWLLYSEYSRSFTIHSILPKISQKILPAALGICRIDRKGTHVRFFSCAGGSGLV